ncbi:MAG: hypothetical protein JXA15_08480 [Spirochaetales bacterium]|nr:hypothetical protein [Spirochaetales bacterium]
MKKAMLLLLAAVTLLGFVACPSPTGSDPVDLTSDWKIKGSFDSWATHNFTMDELDNNILTYTYSSLRAIDYEFVLMNAAGGELKYSTETNVAVDTPFTMGSGAINASFTATTVEVTVTVDISVPASPVVTLVTSGAAATPYNVAELAEGLFIKGDMFTIGWTNTAGTLVDNADGTGTVTFAGLTAASKTGSFGFDSRDGFLKGVSVVSPTVADSSTAPVGLQTSGDNCVITDIPNSDSVYTIVITIDEDGATIADKYSMVVTLTSVGTTAWAFDPPVSIWLVGDLKGATDMTTWSTTDDGRAQVDLVSDVATYAFTADTTYDAAFKYATAADSGWDNLVGFTGVDSSTSPVTVVNPGGGGNIGFAATSGNTYTIVIDFSTDYAVTGIPVLTITETTP